MNRARWRCWWFALLACLVVAWPAASHEVRPAYLQLREAGPDTWDVSWKVPALGEERRLALDVEFADGTVRVGASHVAWRDNAFVQQWRVRRIGGLAGTEVRIAGLPSTLTDVLVRIERRDGTTQTTMVRPASPRFTIDATPGRVDVAKTYVTLGVEHILSGIDHLLFVFALLLLVRPRAQLLWAITAFTVAHSITLAAATLGLVHVPPPPVEASIALSIAFLAAELVRERRGKPGLASRAPWSVAFAFGLLHGLGFAGALSEVGLPQHAIPLALFCFNVGVEIGQLAFIAAVLAVFAVCRTMPVRSPAWARTASAYAIGGVAMAWTLQRIAQF
jgi:hydrogenase/urease accessory protein HupE